MSTPTCPKCGDTGSLLFDIDGLQDCTACDAVERRAEMYNHLIGLSPYISVGAKAWAAYQFALSRPVATPVLKPFTPQRGNPTLVISNCSHVMNMGNDIYVRLDEAEQVVADALAAVPAIAMQDARDAVRYRWLRHGDNDEKVIQHGPLADDFVYLPRNFKLDEMIDAAIATGEKAK